MPELEAVGAEVPDLEPVILPIIAHQLDGTAVTEKFSFQPRLSAGTRRLAEEHQNDSTATVYIDLLNRMLMPDERDRFTMFLEHEDLIIEMDTLSAAFGSLWGHYGRRPTRPRGGSPRAGKRKGKTSTAA